MHVLFRTDGSQAIGTGHVMRCLALAQACKRMGDIPVFLSAALPPHLSARLKKEDVSLHGLRSPPYGPADVQETIEVAAAVGAQAIVLDGYGFPADMPRTLRAAGYTVLVIDDDGGAGSYDAQYVLNQNASARADLYASRGADTVLLLDPRYCLLRQEFLRWRTDGRKIPDRAARLLLTLGGADPGNATLRVLQALRNVQEPLEITIVIGGANPHREGIEKYARSFNPPARCAVQPDMPRLMMEADMAISAGGTTCYELAFLQVPTLALVIADNQRPVVSALAERGSVVDLGAIETVENAAVAREVSALIRDPDRRRAMVEAGTALVDGYGADRVRMHLAGSRLWLRPAIACDARRLWEWANDPETRKQSFSSDTILWETHVAWFQRLLSDPVEHCLIAMDTNDRSIGTIRFTIRGEAATLSVNVAPEARGSGFGTELVTLGARRMFAAAPVRRIDAFVKPDNTASSALFRKAGFREEQPDEVSGHSALHFVLDRDMLKR